MNLMCPLDPAKWTLCQREKCAWWMKGERCAVTSAAISLVYISKALKSFEDLLEEIDLPTLMLKP